MTAAHCARLPEVALDEAGVAAAIDVASADGEAAAELAVAAGELGAAAASEESESEPQAASRKTVAVPTMTERIYIDGGYKMTLPGRPPGSTAAQSGRPANKARNPPLLLV